MDNSLSHPCSCILVYLIYSILIVYCHGERITLNLKKTITIILTSYSHRLRNYPTALRCG